MVGGCLATLGVSREDIGPDGREQAVAITLLQKRHGL
jgi:hypothetical protein